MSADPAEMSAPGMIGAIGNAAMAPTIVSLRQRGRLVQSQFHR